MKTKVAVKKPVKRVQKYKMFSPGSGDFVNLGYDTTEASLELFDYKTLYAIRFDSWSDEKLRKEVLAKVNTLQDYLSEFKEAVLKVKINPNSAT